jgi:hypothetical protein
MLLILWQYCPSLQQAPQIVSLPHRSAPPQASPTSLVLGPVQVSSDSSVTLGWQDQKDAVLRWQLKPEGQQLRG